jgi:uncharacterized protein YjiS (DUF1127 family)
LEKFGAMEVIATLSFDLIISWLVMRGKRKNLPLRSLKGIGLSKNDVIIEANKKCWQK